jgi:hypothetical protein
MQKVTPQRKEEVGDIFHSNVVGIRACLLTVERSRDLEDIIRALDQIIKYAEQLKWLAKGER